MAYVKVNSLWGAIQYALETVGYRKHDIEVRESATVTLQEYGGDGYRHFAAMLNVDTGELTVHRGSWGGPNAYDTKNLIDTDDGLFEVPMNVVVVKGYEGGTSGGVRATIIVAPGSKLVNVPCIEDDLMQVEKHVLNVMRTYVGGYRKEMLLSYGHIVSGLVEKGYIKRAKNGALSLTIKGKSAASER
jgi:hypothetical protein